MIILRYFQNLLIALDETVNTVFLGSPHETISSRLGRNYPNSVLARAVNFLFFWTPNHCQTNIDPVCDEDEAIVR